VLEAIVQSGKPPLIVAEDVKARRSRPWWSSCAAASRSRRSRPRLRRSLQGHARGHRDPHRRPADLGGSRSSSRT
jgi:hypothetical protein